jgi:hypothetical protein
MSAGNLFARPSGAWLVSDTAWYADDGTVMAMSRKVASSDRLRMAIGITGHAPGDVQHVLQAWLLVQPDQLTAVAGLPRVLRLLDADDASGRHSICGPQPPGILLCIALWDIVADAAKVAIMGSVERLSAGAPPFSLRPLKTMFSPALADDRWPGHSFDPVTDCEQLARLQRASCHEHGGSRVGGEFVAWRAHRGGVESRVVCSWPDRLGHKIQLEPLDEAA